ncbi:MAG: hypothetical protein NZ928_00370 [Endomicrobia bacterium]|nr:hypothetical protein [Endomicrobiia bacterium]
MFIIKFRRLINLLRENRFDLAYKFGLELVKNYPLKTSVYTVLAKVCLRKNDLNECKKWLSKLLLLPNWYNKKTVQEILEITNWKMLMPNKYFCKEPKFSNDGDKIVFVCATRDTNNDGVINNDDFCGIYSIDRNSNRLECLVEDKYYNSSPVFSPDGKYICFLSARRDTNSDNRIDSKDWQGLYLLNLQTGEERLLVEDIYQPKHPSFFPDGSKVIFTCWRSPNAKSGVYEINLNDFSLKTLVPDTYESVFPSYSPDGKHILYSSFCKSEDAVGGPEHHCAIVLKNLFTSEITCICPAEYISSFPVFSHDGKKIAYLSKRRDTNRDGVINSLDNDGMYIYNLARRKERCIHSDRYYNKYINFTYDDKYIVFLSTWHSKYKEIGRDFFEYKGIYMIKITGGKVRQIVSDKYYGSHSPCVSPTRYEVVYTSFRKNTLRGLYLAYLDRLPTREEIVEIVNKNLI